MRILITVFLIALLFACDEEDKKKSPPKSLESLEKYEHIKNLPDPADTAEQVTYAIGFDLAKKLELMGEDFEDVDYDYLLAGIMHGLKDSSGFLTYMERDQMMHLVQQLQREGQMKQQSRDMAEAERLGEEFKDNVPMFLEENKKLEDWNVTESGLQYKVIEEGDGIKPNEDLVVKVHLIGKFINGDEFDNTYKRGEPFEMPVEGLERGLREAITMMKIGSKYKFVIPPDLAFGEEGAPPQIPPHAALIMEIELLDIVSTIDEFRKKNRRPPPQQQGQPPRQQGVPPHQR